MWRRMRRIRTGMRRTKTTLHKHFVWKRLETRSSISGMDAQIDIQKFAEKLVKAGREGVAWEQKKLEWIREEKAKKGKSTSEAA
jgi:hypothetical protein